MAVFGPNGRGANRGLEVLRQGRPPTAGVPTAEELAEPRAPCVVKADGLAAGKGVFVCETRPSWPRRCRAPRRSAAGIVVEELLEGREVSLFALCDGKRALTLAPAQDFKRLLDDDRGPNTGGMGSVLAGPVARAPARPRA